MSDFLGHSHPWLFFACLALGIAIDVLARLVLKHHRDAS